MFKHLEATGFGYLSHLSRAWSFSVLCLKTSIKAWIHGLVPDLFPDGSRELETWIKNNLASES